MDSLLFIGSAVLTGIVLGIVCILLICWLDNVGRR